MYKKPDQRVIDRDTERFNNIIAQSSLKECIMGENKQFRITSRDSYYSTITDSVVVLENIIYPAFLDGNQEIVKKLKDELNILAESKEPLEYFQVCCFYSSEQFLDKYYGGIPVMLFDAKLLGQLRNRIQEMKNSLINYRYGEFGKIDDSLYEIASDILAE